MRLARSALHSAALRRQDGVRSIKDAAERMTSPLSLRVSRRIAGVLALTLVPGVAVAETPCAGVDRRLPEAERPALERAVAAEMELPQVKLLQSYRHKGWHILYVNTLRTDEAFLFYRRDPPRGRILARWGGAARMDEGPEIRRWVRRNVPGIPARLATCFAWHVTRDRDM